MRLETELDTVRRLGSVAAGSRPDAAPAADSQPLLSRIDALLAELAHIRTEHRDALDRHAVARLALEDRLGVLGAELIQRQDDARDGAHRLASALQQVDALQREIATFQRLPTIRLRDALLRTPLVGAAIQRMARRLASD